MARAIRARVDGVEGAYLLLTVATTVAPVCSEPIEFGTHQASISRLERATYQPNLGFLQRVAEALDARVEIRLIPKERTDHAQT